MSDKSGLVAQFVGLTQVPPAVAESLLERNKWEIELALEDFYNGPTHRPNAESIESASSQQSQQPASDARSSASSSGSSTARKPKPSSTSKFKSFSELINGESQENDDDDPNLFAGGGRGSGLEIENPNNPQNLVQDLLKKAERGEGHPDRTNREEESKPQAKFDGVGYQLGDNASESRKIGSSNAYKPKRLEKAIREITFWKDGFQVGDGDLYRYDDPANATYLAELNSGRAPLSLLNVEYGQDVDVNVQKKVDEEFKPPKKKTGGFHGQGQRLGSPVSGEYIPPVSEPETKAEETVLSNEKEVEEKQEGDSQVQIRLADGRRIIRKFNASDPVDVIYQFVKGETSNSSKLFTLNYAFPVKPIEDLQQSIKQAGLVNSVVIQRWVQ